MTDSQIDSRGCQGTGPTADLPRFRRTCGRGRLVLAVHAGHEARSWTGGTASL